MDTLGNYVYRPYPPAITHPHLKKLHDIDLLICFNFSDAEPWQDYKDRHDHGSLYTEEPVTIAPDHWRKNNGGGGGGGGMKHANVRFSDIMSSYLSSYIYISPKRTSDWFCYFCAVLVVRGEPVLAL